MKKRTIALILLFCVILGGTAMAAGGSTSDPLISLSYLNSTYWSGLSAKVSTAVANGTKPTYDSVLSQLSGPSGGNSSTGGTDDAARWLSSGAFKAQRGEQGDTVTLALGASLLWNSGTAAVSGPLVDATTGEELSAGAALSINHRYLAPEQVTVTVTSQTAGWSVQGNWHTTAESGLPFTDVPPDSWYYDAVCYAVEKELFNGTSATTFSPLTTMWRGMLTTVLHRMSGSPAAAYSDLFSDVPDGLWYTEGTIWAGQNGVVSGTGDGRFLPENSVARQEIAVILYNYARALNYDVSTSGVSLNTFSDGGSVADWAQEAMSWSVSTGMIQGSNGKVMPTASATRAEVAIMLQRFQTWMDQQ